MFVKVISGDFAEDSFLLNPQCSAKNLMEYVEYKTCNWREKLAKSCDWFGVEMEELEGLTIDLCDIKQGSLCNVRDLPANANAEERFEHRETYLLVVLDRAADDMNRVRTVVPLMTSCDMIYPGLVRKMQPDLETSKLKFRKESLKISKKKSISEIKKQKSYASKAHLMSFTKKTKLRL